MAAENALYWIDVKAPSLHRLDLGTRAAREWRLSSDVGAFALVAGEAAALVALRHGLHRLDLASGALTLLAPPPFDPARTRFNEGACDSSGRFWVGTMFDPLPDTRCPDTQRPDTQRGPEPAGLSSFTLAGGLRAEPDASELHNGMGWSPDGARFYLSHSRSRTVFAFAFDAAAGTLGERRGFVTIPAGSGVPDGAAIDEAGGYWCALHGGGRLHRYHADGSFDRAVGLPVSQPTMCAFVGPELDRMVVTSASDGLGPEALAEQPHAGGLFRFRPGIRGIARHCHVR